MRVTATLIAYLPQCRRKLWLHAHDLRMEHTSDLVSEGKLIGETSYGERAQKNTQLELDGVVIDYYDAKTRTVHETKKSDKMEHAHIAQVKFYLWVLHRNGITDARGRIEYPKLRQTTDVPPLSEQDHVEVASWVADIEALMAQERCPAVLNKPVCKQCSYFDFCYANE